MQFATQFIQLDGCDQLLQLHGDVVPSPLVVRLTFDYASIAWSRASRCFLCAWFFSCLHSSLECVDFFHIMCTCRHRQLWSQFCCLYCHRGFLTWCIVVQSLKTPLQWFHHFRYSWLGPLWNLLLLRGHCWPIGSQFWTSMQAKFPL